VQIDGQSGKRLPGVWQALFAFGGVLALIGAGLFWLDASLHAILFLCLCWIAVHLKFLGYSFAEARAFMSRGIADALPAIYIFILIGMVIASFMLSGTIAALINWGLDWLTPGTFLVSSFLACSLMSVATGTSWGTVGTLGVVMMGVGAGLGVSPPLVAGAVISGATFGDKLSPVSDTTNLAAMSAGTNLYTHIGAMLYTTVPTFLIVLAVLFAFDQSHSGQWDPGRTREVQAALNNLFEINLLVGLGPIALMLVLAVRRHAAEVTMTASIFLAGFLALVFQERTLTELLSALWQNAPTDTGMVELDSLLGRGGIFSMSWTLLLALMALALGGLLSGGGFLAVLLEGLIARIRRRVSLVAATIGSGVVGNMGLGEAYVSIILNCQLFRGAFRRQSLSPAVLSRSVEEGATLTTGLIPWTTAGAFYAATLGVATLEYAPYAFFNYLNGFVAVGAAAVGFGLLGDDRAGAGSSRDS
jgi:NhaC family Na+:H+ antiporter